MHHLLSCLTALLFAFSLAAQDDNIEWPTLVGGESALEETFMTLDAGEMDAAAWRRFVVTQGGNALPFIVELRRNRGYEAAAYEGFIELVSELDLDIVFAALQALPPEQRERLLTLVDMLPTESSDLYFNMRLLKLLRAAGEYQRAYEQGLRGWHRWPNQAFVAHTTITIMEGKLQSRVWELAGARLMAIPNPDMRAAELEFYAELAHRLKSPPVIRPMLRVARLQTANLGSILALTNRFGDLDMRDLVVDLLEESREPALIYQKIRVGMDREPDEEEWREISNAATTTLAALRLAILLTNNNSVHAPRMWERVIDDDSLDPQILANGRLQLGEHAQMAGDFATAAEHYTRMLELLKETPHELTGERLERFQRLIQRLREHAESGASSYPVLLHQAQMSLKNHDLKGAGEQLQEATKLKPDSFEAWVMLFEVIKQEGRYDALPAIGRRLVELTPPPDNVPLLLSGAVHLADAGYFDQAVGMAEQVLATTPDDVNAWLILASVQERAGHYPQARQALAKVAPHASDSFRYWRIMAMIEAQTGQHAKAAEAFERVIEHGYLDDYLRLWQALMERRAGTLVKAELQRYLQVRGEAIGPWLRDLYRHVLGELTIDELLASAATGKDANEISGRLSEGHFYIAQVLLAVGQNDAAKRHLEATLAQGITAYVEHCWAAAELRLLESSPPPAP